MRRSSRAKGTIYGESVQTEKRRGQKRRLAGKPDNTDANTDPDVDTDPDAKQLVVNVPSELEQL